MRGSDGSSSSSRVAGEEDESRGIVYVGDDYNGDVELVTRCGARRAARDGRPAAGWFTIAVVEELEAEVAELAAGAASHGARSPRSGWGAMHWCEHDIDAVRGMYARTPSWLAAKIAAAADDAIADVADLITSTGTIE